MNLVNFLAHVSSPVVCGTFRVPVAVVNLIRDGIFVIQVIVPILLILWGMLDFAKGIIQQEEDKIKAGQKKFIQRLIAAVIVFLIVAVVGFVIGVVGGLGGDGNEGQSAWDCAAEVLGSKNS